MLRWKDGSKRGSQERWRATVVVNHERRSSQSSPSPVEQQHALNGRWSLFIDPTKRGEAWADLRSGAIGDIQSSVAPHYAPSSIIPRMNRTFSPRREFLRFLAASPIM